MGRMITRRSLLLGFGGLALTQIVSACQFWQRPPQFLAEFLASSIPATLLKQFQSQIKGQAQLKPIPIAQLSEGVLSTPAVADSNGLLQGLPWVGDRSAKQAKIPDVVSVSDSWLQTAIERQQLEPLDFPEESAWQTLPNPFQSIVTRNSQGLPDSQGKVWGAPYRWGHLMVAYRVDQFEKEGLELNDWDDLWQDGLKGHLSLLDSDRVVLGLVLKSLGRSINTEDLNAVSDLKQRLAALHQQAKFYSSDSYLQPLLLKDTWVAVGWSMDILPLMRRDRRIGAIVPKSGTILTADVWVKPIQPEKNSDENPPQPQNEQTRNDQASLVNQWIDFFWESSVATQLSLLSPAASPMVLSISQDDIPTALTNDKELIPPKDIMDNSEFLAPLEDGAIALYQEYWTEMRQG